MPIQLRISGIRTPAEQYQATRSLKHAFVPFVNGTGVSISWLPEPRRQGRNQVKVRIPREAIRRAQDEELALAIQMAIGHHGHINIDFS